jgi:bifunctional DNA-binding transcriptional regulator/antitoxin component of YhaV-PrlF toxin-antitoxin module
MTTEVLTIKENGKFTLPDEIVERYQFKKETQFRIIPTQKGVLLIPMASEPMRSELKNELEEWQSIGENAWEMFDFEENTE